MDGILLIDKPKGMTSRDVVNKLMKKFNTRKIGHTGTLDPFASGLLIVTINKGTRISSYIEDLNKQYVTEIKLGEGTSTLDLEGEVIEKKEVMLPLDIEKVKNVVSSFCGDISQIPPMYSAIKINGEELYKKARRGEVVERKPRNIHITKIEILSIENEVIKLKVDCSKGTYIRTLGEDIANKLSYPGHLTMLTRTKVGKFDLSQAKTIEEVSQTDIINICDSLDHMIKVVVDEKNEFKVKNGVKMKFSSGNIILVVNKNNQALAIYQKKEDGLYHCLRGLW